MRMAPVVAGGFWRKAAATQFTIDESVAVGLSQDTPRARQAGFWVTGIAIWLGWNVSTLIGALLGDVLGDPRTYGLDAAAAAAFLALLWPRLRGRQPWAVAAGAAVVAALLTPWLMPGIPVIAAAGVAVAAGLFDPRRPSTPPGATPEEKGMP
jgi:predicted branched-subunit amino acid permease